MVVSLVETGYLAAGAGQVPQRARGSGAAGDPFGIQLPEFPSAGKFDDFMNDGRRVSLADEPDRAIAKTQVIHVQMVSVRYE